MDATNQWRRQRPLDLEGGVRMAAIVLTGASAGIGAAAAVELTRLGHQVLATGRSESKLQTVHGRMHAAAPSEVEVPTPVVIDLASLSEVRRLASILLDRYPVIDVLANNAGLSPRPRQLSADGFELAFAVNHLAPFLLTNLLKDRLAESGGRVVTTSSAVHRIGRIHFDDLALEHGWSSMRAYSQSKLANILFTSELRRRTGLPATCFHPGGVNTELSRDSRLAGLTGLLGRFMRSPEQGADTLVWLATSDEGRSHTAVYYANRKPARTSAAANDSAAAARLWNESAQMVGLTP
jgi:NAD(P)-dependent dehydrogenase (short-subunit alcohol dehydrogenase family)